MSHSGNNSQVLSSDYGIYATTSEEGTMLKW